MTIVVGDSMLAMTARCVDQVIVYVPQCGFTEVSAWLHCATDAALCAGRQRRQVYAMKSFSLGFDGKPVCRSSI